MFGFGFGFGNFAPFGKKMDGKVESDKKDEKLLSKQHVLTLDNEDGASIVEMGGSDVVSITTDFQTQSQKIEEYRTIARMPEVRRGIEEIINDMVSCDDHEDPVSLLLDDCVDISESTKEMIREEFDNILRMVNFDDDHYKLAKKWYIDGKLFAHPVVDEKRMINGIQKIIFLDPRCTRLVERRQYAPNQDGVDVVVKRERMFVYNPSILTQQQRQDRRNTRQQSVSIPEDAVVFAYTHDYDPYGMQVGALDEVVKYANDLRNMEDAVVIYRLVNAPERRVYYVDTGNLPKNSAEDLIRKVRARFRSKVTYDSASGKVKSETKNMAMTDAIWLPRREGSNATEVDILQGGQNLGEIDDVTYYQKKLIHVMGVPIGRYQEDSMINIGGNNDEMTREELKFARTITRRRREFNALFKGLLKRQLILKRITTKKDWDILIEPHIKFSYAAESATKAIFEAQQLQDRFSNLDSIEPYVGSLISRKTVLTKVLRMSEEDIADEEKQIQKERDSGLYPEPDPDDMSERTGLRPTGSQSMKFKVDQ